MSMKRRDFLRATLVSAGALLTAAACDDDGGDDDGSGGAGGGGGGGGAGGGGGGECPPRAVEAGERYFPQSVASGDPRADGFILWTRVVDEARAGADVPVELELALDEQFAQCVSLDGAATRALTASPASDHCVKARVAGLTAGTTYYYRFLVQVDGATFASRTGRAKTAAAPDADVPVRFAVVSCQDFNGRYYNVYRQLATMDLDFFVHLGDYIYETTGDRTFQDTTPERAVVFSAPAEAIVFNAGTENEYFAAKSLSNYRDLYKIYRGDPDLQRAHELFPMVPTWDDHEFSDDCWGATATYFDGAQDETDVQRRKAANQAWFEYMPVDYEAGPEFRYDPAADFPGDLEIFRDLTFGRHVHLVMTDLRTWRSDHLVPEDAFPGAIALTQERIQAVQPDLPDFLVPYVDVDTHEGGAYAQALRDAAVPEEVVRGPMSVPFINDTIEGGALPPIEPAGLPRGLAYRGLFKIARYGIIGSRYLVSGQAFDLYAKVLWTESNGRSEQAMGEDQERWFLETMRGSDRTWKIWGNEYTLTSRRVDLRNFAPEGFRELFVLSAEDWDGLPNRRDLVLGQLGEVDNVVAVTGDIHAFFAGTPRPSMAPDRKIVELVTGAVSSGTYQTLLTRQASADPVLANSGGPVLASIAETLVMDDRSRPNPTLGYAKLSLHGFISIVADGATLEATFHQIAEPEAAARIEDAATLAGKFTLARFKVEAGVRELFMRQGDAWRRWDPEAYAWV